MEKAGRGLPYLLFSFRFLNFYEKKKRGMHIHTSLFLVPLTGLEPVRILLRGILSPLCLPIPPQRRCFYYTTRSAICQGLFEKNLIFFLFLQIPCSSNADKVLVLKDGTIVESGTPEELMQKQSSVWEVGK